MLSPFDKAVDKYVASRDYLLEMDDRSDKDFLAVKAAAEKEYKTNKKALLAAAKKEKRAAVAAMLRKMEGK